MLIWQFIFLVSLFLVFYNYIGYVIPVYVFNKFNKRISRHTDGQEISDADLPTVSFIVAAYNEQDCIAQKIANSLQQDYPSHKVEYLFVTDGSTDETSSIVGRFAQIRSLHQPERRGKSAAMNRAVKEARHDIIIFSDANTILNPKAIRHIARHYLDPKVGGVAGEKKVLSGNDPGNSSGNEVGEAEGLYWKYESFLKRQDAAFYSVVGAAGELFSIRSALYESIPDNVILDDFIISLKCASKGYRIRYEPQAYAMELPSFSIQDEGKRKVRIAAGGFQAIGMLPSLLAFWKYPRLTYLYISHRVMRWTLSPLAMILAFISNGILCAGSPAVGYKVIFAIQLAFYGTALLAGIFPNLKQRSKLVKLIGYFVFMNLSVIQGFFRFLRGKQAATWEKAKRAQPNMT